MVETVAMAMLTIIMMIMIMMMVDKRIATINRLMATAAVHNVSEAYKGVRTKIQSIRRIDAIPPPFSSSSCQRRPATSSVATTGQPTDKHYIVQRR